MSDFYNQITKTLSLLMLEKARVYLGNIYVPILNLFYSPITSYSALINLPGPLKEIMIFFCKLFGPPVAEMCVCSDSYKCKPFKNNFDNITAELDRAKSTYNTRGFGN